MFEGEHEQIHQLNKMCVYKLTERMSKSCMLGIFNHLRRKCFFTLGSAWKMARGMALMEKYTNQSVSHSKLLLPEILQSTSSPQTFNSGKATPTSFYLVPARIRISITSIIMAVFFFFFEFVLAFCACIGQLHMEKEGMETGLTCNKVTWAVLQTVHVFCLAA